MHLQVVVFHCHLIFRGCISVVLWVLFSLVECGMGICHWPNQDRDFLKEKGLPLQAIYDPIVKSGPPSCLLHKVAIVMANQSTPPNALPSEIRV